MLLVSGVGFRVSDPQVHKSLHEISPSRKSEPQNSRISNVEGRNRFAQSLLKWTEHIHWTFDLPEADKCLLASGEIRCSFVSFLIKLAVSPPAAGLTPDTRHLKPIRGATNLFEANLNNQLGSARRVRIRCFNRKNKVFTPLTITGLCIKSQVSIPCSDHHSALTSISHFFIRH